MANDVPDWTQAVDIGTATIPVTGTVTIQAGQSGVNVSTDTPPVSLGQITINAGDTSGYIVPTIPANCTALAVLPVGLPGTLNWQLINRVWWGGGVAQISWQVTDLSPTIFPVVGSDQGYAVTVSVPSAELTTMVVAEVVALIGYGGEQVYAPINQPLYVQQVGTPAVGAAPVQSAYGRTSLGTNTVSGVIGGVANEVITVLAVDLEVEAYGGLTGNGHVEVFLNDASLMEFARLAANIDTAAGIGSVHMSKTFPFPPQSGVGAGIRLNCPAQSVNIFCSYSVLYTQG